MAMGFFGVKKVEMEHFGVNWGGNGAFWGQKGGIKAFLGVNWGGNGSFWG